MSGFWVTEGALPAILERAAAGVFKSWIEELEILLALLRGHDVRRFGDQFARGLGALAVEAAALFDVAGKFDEIDLTGGLAGLLEGREGLLHLRDLVGEGDEAWTELFVNVANAGELVVVELEIGFHPSQKRVEVRFALFSGGTRLGFEQGIDEAEIALRELDVALGVLLRSAQLKKKKTEQHARGGEGDAEGGTGKNGFQAIEPAGSIVGIVGDGDTAPDLGFEVVGSGRALPPLVEQSIERIFGRLHGFWRVEKVKRWSGVAEI